MKKNNYNRRDVLGLIGGAVLTGELANLTQCLAQDKTASNKPPRPNILWITCEDTSPYLGCYGDSYALTPNLDRLAAEGILYNNAYATAPVCAPARSCLITGIYATTLGTQHLRSKVKIPQQIKCFTEYLRNAGYYCSNNVKQDYNFDAPNAWNESSNQAHWRKRKNNQPFFSVFNITNTHQSLTIKTEEQIQKITSQLKPHQLHHPDKAKLPPYYPDNPLTRKTWARYHNMITFMDRRVGQLLDRLKQDGLQENTIVFFFSDHGMGLPRFKRSLYDSGLRVPLIVKFPHKYKNLAPAPPGSQINELVSFVDFAPTVLNLAGLPIPDHMQGRPFLGHRTSQPHQYVYGAVSRVDEVYDLSRSVRDKRYKYIRNYMPHLPYVQASNYPDRAQVMKELRRLLAQDKLNRTQSLYFSKTKPIEELYDTKTDPHEINNLTDSPQHHHILQRMREVHLKWILDTHDTGFLPEADMHIRATGSTPYQMARQTEKYPQQKIVSAAQLVHKGTQSLPDITNRLKDPDAAVRYWAAVALEALGQQAKPAAPVLTATLTDPVPTVRLAAALALCKQNSTEDAIPVLLKCLQDHRPWVALQAARGLQNIGNQVCDIPKQALEINNNINNFSKNYKMYIQWAIQGAKENCQP
ncbi:MAG: sulfatase-like hydrolase/transferase [Planctomycetota bacterium]|jgi:uncharacterized sulfatase